MSADDLPFKFYSETHLPNKLSTIDLLYWVAASIVPEAFFQYSDIEGREDPELLIQSPLEFGLEFLPMWFEKTETERLGIFDDPRMIFAEAEDSFDRYSLNTSSLQSTISWQFEGSDEDRIQLQLLEAANLLGMVSEYEALLHIWKNELDDALDQYKADLTVRLRRGEIEGEGILLTVPNTNDISGEVNEALNLMWDAPSKFDNHFKTIPKELWLTRTLDWNGSFLRDDRTIYLGVRFSASEVFTKFPPMKSDKLTAHELGNSLLVYSDTSRKHGSVLNRGRPKKNWDAVSVRIAEIVQERGNLPAKQDALAHELCEWYQTEFGEKIGVSTVHAKISRYYRSSIIQNSRN